MTSSELSALWLTTTLVVGTYRNWLQFGSFDQTQRYAKIMKPVLQFGIHRTPFRECSATRLRPLTPDDSA
jgi:hypothetical protein